MIKNVLAEGSKLPQRAGQTTDNKKIPGFINVSPLFPLEPNLLLYIDCSQLPHPIPVCDPSGNFPVAVV